jgi:hypothetical protein
MKTSVSVLLSPARVSFIGCLLCMILGSPTQAQIASIKPVGVGPFTANVAFWVEVRIGDPNAVSNLYGVNFKLKSSAATCSYVDGSATMGDFLGTSPLTFFQSVDAQTVDMTVSKTSGTGVNGTGLIAKAQFVSSVNGSVTFTLLDITATDPAGGSVALSALPAVVTVGTITQPILSVLPADCSVSSDAGTTSFDVSNTGVGTMSWTATSSQSWAIINSGSSGTSGGTISVSYSANSSTASSRTATITVAASGATGSPKQVTITQSGTSTGNLVAYYPFTGNANDVSGNGHNGTVFGATLTSDRFGNSSSAFAFNGSSYIRAPNSSALQPGAGSFSLSTWIYVAAVDNAKSDTYIIDMSDGDSDYSGYELMFDHATGKIVFYFHYDDYWAHQTTPTNSTTVQVGKWYHVVAVLNRAQATADLYLNGVLENSRTSDPNNVTALSDLYFGRRNLYSPSDAYLQGRVDDTRMYNRALTEAEILALYNENKPTDIKGSEDISPEGFSLSQNYPNPFNPSTTIRYGLPERSRVSLAVYNTLGQQVTVLQNGEQEAGYYDAKFDASTLPSGVYFSRLQAGSYVETRKLCLVR